MVLLMDWQCGVRGSFQVRDLVHHQCLDTLHPSRQWLVAVLVLLSLRIIDFPRAM
jgi:hypothetical protein